MKFRTLMLSAGVAGWLALSGASIAALLSFDLRPSAQSVVPSSLSEISPCVRALLQLDSHRPTLVAFFHPHCPCSRATGNQLVSLASHAGERLAICVVVVTEGTSEEIDDVDAIASLRKFPQTRVIVDAGGRIAAAVGAQTSGYCLMYNADGRLAFEGGVTPSRGHEGYAKGIAAIERLVTGQTPAVRRSEVYGCALRSPDAVAAPESTGGCASCQTPQ